ncbi:MAG: MBL fold metallo-hydrolase [Calditrichaeota bacterium]|nr:MAG: MBL fold metallo-hydrolase [Calditrichota bacterium]
MKLAKLIVLGTAQDGGLPQAGCLQNCCDTAWQNTNSKRLASCLALFEDSKKWLIDATPDFREQIHHLEEISPNKNKLDGIFLTHAHVGHYAGLLHLGREVMNTKQLPVFATPQMCNFLSENAPWEQLVKLKNINLIPLENEKPIELSESLKITSFAVPHRSEYTDTVGFLVEGSSKKVIFIPDIDDWEKWNVRVEDLISEVDFAFLDGTFYSEKELPNRNLDEIPHPLISRSIERFSKLSKFEQEKIYFTHFNHSNPILNLESEERKEFEKLDIKILEELLKFEI